MIVIEISYDLVRGYEVSISNLKLQATRHSSYSSPYCTQITTIFPIFLSEIDYTHMIDSSTTCRSFRKGQNLSNVRVMYNFLYSFINFPLDNAIC